MIVSDRPPTRATMGNGSAGDEREELLGALQIHRC